MKETLRAAIFDVFERMFYVFLEPFNDDCLDYAMEASIKFSGALGGELRILFSEELASSMVHNLLGLEKDKLTEHNIADCMKEAANMICGNFLGKLDRTKVFDLSMPSFSRRSGKVVQGTDGCSLCFDSDCGRFGAVLTLME